MLKFINKIFGWCYPLFKKIGWHDTVASYSSLIVNIIILWLFAYLIYKIFRFILVSVLAIIAQRTHSKFDDFLIANKTAKYISYLIPLLFIYKSVPIILNDYVYWEGFFGKFIGIYIVLLTLWIIRTIFNALRDYLKLIPQYSDKPIDSYIQVFMIILWMIGLFVIILELFEIKTNTLFTAFGAVSAVILLIFRDTILGFVASVQVSLNDMVRIGDWVTFDKFGADGDVIEINLATVKVRNFDLTTTTIPTYSLISDSFKNWRGMQNSSGRRIKRFLLIKSHSVHFLSDIEIENLSKIQLIHHYISQKQSEIDIYNANHQINKDVLVNGRNLTNLGLFRVYITKYLERHAAINQDMFLVCRQLQPTQHGIPLEIYAFSKDKKWENYEYIVSDLFDHFIAAVPYFNLEIFELPSEKHDV
ncbi:mechanosensitive ion channel protein MscS [Flavobacterium branchiophilum NBRC 15030 = ATCC 35035]|uniref:Miniconductance mechanosensitive channel n=1 Tax=Flavobacterium branchiophilum TaxID=55197 RepID=A0A543G7S5_9FLAO|nr:mechanosensitive ion channel domain-containing protein [Flavobacterium branchiophilum]OXA75968.1 mechanosensitive ion channel protein MscS [Flavobacterium branchiophilum NBRC 15030 = ATCC 35035]TQM42136.1 miniconductance mechanosensitive channel [Flavobacterium branchiophilum]GEM53909.1 mechanosensitive ion channel protein MscS [Flavobacterium branchiophilum NBRC 15030 = ATCC 35035]